MKRVGSLIHSVPLKITSAIDSLRNVLKFALVDGGVYTDTGWEFLEDGNILHLVNNAGAVCRVVEYDTYATIQGLNHLGDANKLHLGFPSVHKNILNVFKNSAGVYEWEVFFEKDFFYLQTGGSLYFFGTLKNTAYAEINMLVAKQVSTDKFFRTSTEQPFKVAYSNISATESVWGAELNLVPEFLPVPLNWQQPDGTIVLYPVAVVDFLQKSKMGNLPGIWVLENACPYEALLSTGSGTNLLIMKKENQTIAFEV